MTPTDWPDNYARDLTADHDRKNQDIIARALENGKIDSATAEYLTRLYSDGMSWFREVFHVLGKCFGAPKAAVTQYDYATDTALPAPVKISDINPLSPYMVHHRLDADPMRNQFFVSLAGHKIDLSVSSIVTVIVGAQKNINRALEKITGKYYQDYINDVAETTYRVIASHEREASGRAIADKVREKFASGYITSASETVLGIIGRGHEKIAVDLVRALDKITPPHLRLQDVWRVKCLFDLIPQARTFIERIHDMMPERILSVKDTFYNMENPRNYRDAKLIIDIGRDGNVVPLEIICQVRTFFEFEHQTHKGYESTRRIKKNAHDGGSTPTVEKLHEQGVKQYNSMVCNCVEDLFDRVGWNILYSQGGTVSMFDGFPKYCKCYYPQPMVDKIISKIDNAVENEVFHFTNAPAKLTQAQESEIYRFMARFVLVAGMPYLHTGWSVPSDTEAAKFFNFIMSEILRYYKKQQ